MKISLLSFALLLFGNFYYSQNIVYKNKGDIYLGGELGASILGNSPFNTISAQGGITSEYYIHRRISLMGKIKVSQMGFAYYSPAIQTSSSGGMGPNFGGMFNRSAYEASFISTNILMPVTIKWQYRIGNRILGYLDVGPYASLEMTSKSNISNNLDFNHKKTFLGFTNGLGFSYQFRNSQRIYIDYGYFYGADMITIDTFIGSKSLNPTSHNISLGYQWEY